MNDRAMEFGGPAKDDSGSGAGGSSCYYLRLALGAFIALFGCELLTTVWRVAGDESHQQAIAAAHALEQARDSTLRAEAIRDLVRPVVIDSTVAIPPLIRSLADRAVEVRVEAVRSLGPAASAAALTNTGDSLVTAAVGALTKSLDDPEPAVRSAAVLTLGSIAVSKSPSGVIQPQSLVNSLITMLADHDATVRASTIAALGLAGPVAAPDPPPALIAALDDESTFNRAAAMRALSRFPIGLDDAGPSLLGIQE